MFKEVICLIFLFILVSLGENEIGLIYLCFLVVYVLKGLYCLFLSFSVIY